MTVKKKEDKLNIYYYEDLIEIIQLKYHTKKVGQSVNRHFSKAGEGDDRG